MKSALALGILGPALLASAHPGHQPKPNEAQLSRRGIDIEAFRLPAKSEYVSSQEVPEVPEASFAKRGDYVETATELVKRILPGASFRLVEDHYIGDNGVAHVNFKQTINGLDLDNADFNVNIGRDGEVFSYGHSFYTGEVPSLNRRDVSDPVTALNGAVSQLGLPVNTESATAEAKGEELFTLKGTSGAQKDPEAKLVYLAKADGSLALTWRVETDVLDNWLLTYVDDATKTVHNVVDYVSDVATYQVYKWGINDPTEGSRTVITDPWVSSASPLQWHNDGTSAYETTRGNNGICQVNPSGGTAYLTNYRPTSSTLDFQYVYTTSQTDNVAYRDASVTQLFYTANKFHDLLYLLGFNEEAGNFQVSNNGRGGRGGDEVILNAQDGSGTNNANFATPPDGQKGRMRMYMWTRSTPRRDCSFEAGVVIHEYAHGLSTRLTGGPSNSGCLSTLEAGGMGEGWGDFLATAIRLKPADTRTKDYPMGAWVNNNAVGIRSYPYSTKTSVNPLTYGSVNSLNAVHAIGTVWATILYEVLWNLIDKLGKNDAEVPTFSNGVPTDGKYLTMKLVVDGMALQPCNPNFVTARQAIVDADVALTGGANRCALWTAFAKRGLGTGAVYSSSRRTESFAVPSGC